MTRESDNGFDLNGLIVFYLVLCINITTKHLGKSL